MSWIDEEAAIYAICQMNHEKVVTKYMSEINFKRSAQTGDILEFGLEVSDVGRTSLTTRCEVRHKISRDAIITVDRIVFVAIDAQGAPIRHRYNGEELSVVNG